MPTGPRYEGNILPANTRRREAPEPPRSGRRWVVGTLATLGVAGVGALALPLWLHQAASSTPDQSLAGQIAEYDTAITSGKQTLVGLFPSIRKMGVEHYCTTAQGYFPQDLDWQKRYEPGQYLSNNIAGNSREFAARMTQMDLCGFVSVRPDSVSIFNPLKGETYLNLDALQRNKRPASLTFENILQHMTNLTAFKVTAQAGEGLVLTTSDGKTIRYSYDYERGFETGLREVPSSCLEETDTTINDAFAVANAARLLERVCVSRSLLGTDLLSWSARIEQVVNDFFDGDFSKVYRLHQNTQREAFFGQIATRIRSDSNTASLRLRNLILQGTPLKPAA